jgi:hypothetical protein
MRLDCTLTGEGYGFVYVMSYPNSNKLKIGHSHFPNTRVAQIGGTLAPETPTLEAYFWCSERREDVERKAHELEAKNRHNGEWFTISLADALEAISNAAKEMNVEIKLVYERDSEPRFDTPEKRQAWLKDRIGRRHQVKLNPDFGYDHDHVTKPSS